MYTVLCVILLLVPSLGYCNAVKPLYKGHIGPDISSTVERSPFFKSVMCMYVCISTIGKSSFSECPL